MLEKKDDNLINEWKSYPGLALIITMAVKLIDTGQTTQLEELTELMLGNESKQSSPLIASIAILIGDKVNSN